MGKTVSVYIDEESISKIKRKGLSVSKAVREALKEWLNKEPLDEDYDALEKLLIGGMGAEGERAWRELQKERDRW